MYFEYMIWLLLMGLCGYLCYRRGKRQGVEPAQKKPQRKRTAPTKEELYYETILLNIDRYDGTETGQQEVKP